MSGHLRAVDVTDSIQQIVCLINYDNTACQINATSLASILVQESVIRDHHHLCKYNITQCQVTWHITWCFSDRASWIDYILITNLMHWLLFIHKILFSSTCFKSQVLIFRRIELYTCSIWYCHSLWEFLVTCRYTSGWHLIR